MEAAMETFRETRRRGLGGSDAAAVLGLNPRRGPMEVWMEKRGLLPPLADSEVMWWGRELESLIARRYAELKGVHVEKPAEALFHPRLPLLAHPDGLMPGLGRGLEIKTTRIASAAEWGEPGTDEVPVTHALQCLHYMAVTGYEEWDLAVLVGGSELRIYHLNCDHKLRAWMEEKLTEWWERHIVRGEEPALDGSEGARAYIHQRYPEQRLPPSPAPPGSEPLARELAVVRAWLARLEDMKRERETRLKALIGDCAAIAGGDWTISWRLAKGRSSTDWEAVARALAAREGDPSLLNDLVAAHTRRGPGVRRFLFTPGAGLEVPQLELPSPAAMEEQ